MLSLLFIASLSIGTAGRGIGWDVLAGQTASAGESIVVEAADHFESLAVSWSADSERVVQVRTRFDDGALSEWTELRVDGDLTDATEGRYTSGIVHFGRTAQSVEVVFDGKADRINVSMFPPAPPPARTGARQSGYTVGPLTIRSRTEWGCPEGEASQWTPAFTNVTHAVVHHTAGANSVANWDAELRSIWYLHTYTNGWGDIGYNFLIDPNGVVYEGRAGGDGAIGAHFSCRNTNTAGVALLGTYSTVGPTAAALASLETLLAELCKRNAIDPLAMVVHAPSGLLLPTIIGHRDGNTSALTCTRTDCPGDVLYSMLPAIRTDIACTPAAIVEAPGGGTIAPGATYVLRVKASGTQPLSYQWYAGESQISGATESTLIVSPSTASRYRVRVANSCGSVDSAEAIVSVSVAPRRRATH